MTKSEDRVTVENVNVRRRPAVSTLLSTTR
jgi:hypothetical protein